MDVIANITRMVAWRRAMDMESQVKAELLRRFFEDDYRVPTLYDVPVHVRGISQF